jgi:hypothetical protein
MALNGGAINSSAVNAAAGGFVSATGSASIGIAQIVNALGTASVGIAAIVGQLSSAVSVGIEQEVTFQQTGSLSVGIDQTVVSTGSKSLGINQLVAAVSEPTTFFGRNGFEPRVYIANEYIPLAQMHGKVEINFTVGDAPQLKFMIIPPIGVQDVRGYRGKVVQCYIRDSDGTTSVYSGKINTPDVQIINQKIAFNCSMDIEQTVNNFFDRTALNQIGYYNNKVFSTPKTKMQELKDRISTIPKELVVDRNGIPDVVNIAAKGTADYTFTNADVRRNDIGIKLSSGQRYINQINIKMRYSFQRLHHQEQGYSANSPHTNVCQLLTNGYTILTRQLVYSAVQGSGWPVKGEILFDPIYASGYYSCGDANVGFSTISCTGTTSPTGAVNDGVEQLEYNASACTNVATSLCTGASWTATKRFAQNINQEYTLTVKAPQSQTTSGLKERDDTFTLSDKFESRLWEDYPAYTASIPSGTSVAGTQSNNFWIDAQSEQPALNTSFDILLNRAKSEILKSHRDDRISFRRALMPAISLKHSIELDTDRIAATGKVHSFTHVMNIGTGEGYTNITLALSQSEGSATDSTLTHPTQPTSTPVYNTANIQLSGHYGEDPATTSGSDKWVGHIANKMITTTTSGKPDLRMTQFPVRFIYDTPDVAPNLREAQDLTATKSYDVEIPNDSMTIDFTDG